MKKIVCLFLFLATITSFTKPNEALPTTTPNVILILADDLGYGDTQPYGQEIIVTPQLRKMAAEGIRFTNAYASSTVCAPSRCGLMTGKHTGHAYIRANDPNPTMPVGDGVPLRAEDVTMAEVLKKKGYRTGMFGKWGLGVKGSSGSPEKQGWDEFYGYLNQAHAHRVFTDSLYRVRNGGVATAEYIGANRYSHDLIIAEAAKFVQKNAIAKKPFFLYLPVTLPHAELKIPKVYMNLYMKPTGQSKLPENPLPSSHHYGPQENPNAAYASIVTKLDSDIGRLIAQLKLLKIDNNTIIVFTSDNGPSNEGGCDLDFFNSTYDLRGKKQSLYEGGIRVPMIVRYPKRIRGGQVSEQPTASYDLMATLSDMLEIKDVPSNDGTSMADIWIGHRSQFDRPPMYWEHYVAGKKELSQAMRAGEWKCVKTTVKGKEAKIELFNLREDREERRNLYTQHPGKAQELLALMNKLSTEPEYKDFVNVKTF